MLTRFEVGHGVELTRSSRNRQEEALPTGDNGTASIEQVLGHGAHDFIAHGVELTGPAMLRTIGARWRLCCSTVPTAPHPHGFERWRCASTSEHAHDGEPAWPTTTGAPSTHPAPARAAMLP